MHNVYKVNCISSWILSSLFPFHLCLVNSDHISKTMLIACTISWVIKKYYRFFHNEQLKVDEKKTLYASLWITHATLISIEVNMWHYFVSWLTIKTQSYIHVEKHFLCHFEVFNPIVVVIFNQLEFIKPNNGSYFH